jgi:hypothetical protein
MLLQSNRILAIRIRQFTLGPANDGPKYGSYQSCFTSMLILSELTDPIIVSNQYVYRSE